MSFPYFVSFNSNIFCKRSKYIKRKFTATIDWLVRKLIRINRNRNPVIIEMVKSNSKDFFYIILVIRMFLQVVLLYVTMVLIKSRSESEPGT
jgi:hypothetical protein